MLRHRKKRARSARSAHDSSDDDESDPTPTGRTDDGRFHVTKINQAAVNDLTTWLCSTAAQQAADGGVPMITINSNGGEVEAALAMADLIAVSVFPVHILVLSHCFSAAMLLLVAVPRQHRFALRSSIFMTHYGENHMSFSSAEELSSELKLHRRLDKRYAKRVARGCTRVLCAGMQTPHNVYMTTRQARAVGLLSSRWGAKHVIHHIQKEALCGGEGSSSSEEEEEAVGADMGVMA